MRVLSLTGGVKAGIAQEQTWDYQKLREECSDSLIQSMNSVSRFIDGISKE